LRQPKQFSLGILINIMELEAVHLQPSIVNFNNRPGVKSNRRSLSNISSASLLIIAGSLLAVVAIAVSLYTFPILSVVILALAVLAFKFFVKRKHLTFFDDTYAPDTDVQHQKSTEENISSKH
jgi:uncharacterized membrane protein